MSKQIVVIPGDGIGPEVIGAALSSLEKLELDFEYLVQEVGRKCWEKNGKALPEETIDLIRETGVCLKGPTWTPPGPATYRSVAVTLRQTLGLYANVRPIMSRDGVDCLQRDVDFIIIRENTEGAYKGWEHAVGDDAIGVRVITKRGCERIARFAFELARSKGRKKVTAVHKANILKETCGLFKRTCEEIALKYPEVGLEEAYVDAATLGMIINPQKFDIVLTTNLFGDILSDGAAGLIGGLGLAPSANIGDEHALFEPAHGVALDIAGKGIANPCAAILSAALMLQHLGEEEEAERLERAVNEVLREGKVLTPDLGGGAKTAEMAEEIGKKLNPQAISSRFQKC